MGLNQEIQYKPYVITDPDYKIVQLIDEGTQIGGESMNAKT